LEGKRKRKNERSRLAMCKGRREKKKYGRNFTLLSCQSNSKTGEKKNNKGIIAFPKRERGKAP